jgi:hypothetical protein
MKKILLEKISIVFSIDGTTISVIIGQPAYSTIPITATIGINYINRRQEMRDLDEAEINTRNKVKATKNSVEKTRGKVEKNKESINKIFTAIQDKNIDIVSKTENDLTENQLSSLEDDIENLVHSVNQVEEKIEEKIEEKYYRDIKVIFERLENSVNNNYTYELIEGRGESRKVLCEALENAEEEIIIVCPWLGFGFNDHIVKLCRDLLEKDVEIKIGWGRNVDIDNDKLNSAYNENSYRLNELNQINYEKFSTKLLGTHEKFIVCDRKFVMLGSHNFLTSTDQEKERELGIKTDDPRIIDQLIKMYYQAENRDSNHQNDESKVRRKSRNFSRRKLASDDIPF